MLPQTTTAAARQLPWRQGGKIVLGRKSEKGFPEDLQFFLIKEKNKSGDYVISKRYHDILGAEPRELNILLPHSDIKMIFNSRANWYGANGARKCHTDDGERAFRWLEKPGQTGPVDKRVSAFIEIACPNEACEYRMKKSEENPRGGQCAAKSIFNFMIPEIGPLGFFMDFGSKVASAQILSTLQMTAALVGERGLYGIRFKLRRTPTTFHIPSYRRPGEQDRVVKYIPMLELDYAALLGQDQALLGPLVGRLEQGAPQLISIEHELKMFEEEAVEGGVA